MKLELRLLNGFLLIIPLLAWNLALGPRLTLEAVISDAHSPAWLLMAENITRLIIFALPLFLPLDFKGVWNKTGLAVYGLGTLIYFASWLPLLLAGFSAGFLMLRGRSYVDRWQAITLAVTAVLIVGAVVARYALVLQSPLAVSISAAILVLLPAAGLTSAAVVPNTIYSPLFRKFVEWIEYLCLMPIFPLALWLMNVYAAIRYR